MMYGSHRTVTKRGDAFELNFPARPPTLEPMCPPLLLAALGLDASCTPVFVGRARDLLLVLPTSADVRAVQVNVSALNQITDAVVVIVSARGTAADGCDFVSRAFVPNCGSGPEDPVCGSAHCTMIPYWAGELKKSVLVAHQLSARGGELFCEMAGDRVKMAGRCRLYLKGDISF